MAITFCAVQLIYSPLLTDWSRVALDPLYGARIVRLRARLSRGDHSALVIALGSSRTDMGVAGSRIEAQLEGALRRPVVAFNFGCAGCGPLMELVLLRRLLHDGVRPALVLIEVMPPLLADVDDGVIEGRWLHAEQLTPDERTRVAPVASLDPSTAPPWTTRWVPTYAYRTLLVGRFAPGWALARAGTPAAMAATVDDWGSWKLALAETVTEAQREADTERRRHEFLGLSTLELGRKASSTLRALLDLCSKEHVPSALVLMPEGSVFRSWYSPRGLMAILRFVRDVAAEQGVEVIDARDWMDDRAFWDSEHLLPAGAEAFSARLATAIDRLVK